MNGQSLFEFPETLLPLERMKKLVDEQAGSYAAAAPFPHIVIDNFFSDEALLDGVLGEFPSKDQIKWVRFNDYDQVKLASKGEQQIGPLSRHLIYHLNSSFFINFLEGLTGIRGLLPDPHLEGGGLHQIMPGGKLGIHADFNKHRRLNLDRRLNLIVYLNKDWEEEYGGHIELWDRDMKSCVRKVLPLFNRAVIFNTTDFAYHGHPTPLTCPEGRSRKSLALYYYSNGRPEEEISDVHTTIFRVRGDERMGSFRRMASRFIPPIVYDARQAIKDKLFGSKSRDSDIERAQR